MKIKIGMAGAAVVMLCFLTACGNEMSKSQTGNRESQMSEITSEQESESITDSTAEDTQETGQVESGLDIVAGQTEDFTGTIELVD